jgi:DNA topoisomerase I
VWICPDPSGHLQATGRDAAGRKQYLYHERWRRHRDRLKFDSMLGFAAALPRLRRHVARDLRAGGRGVTRRISAADLTRARVLACAVRLLDVGFFRIGSEDYADQNGSYGLTTILREHVTIGDHGLVFDYPAKSGQRRVQAITDPHALAVVAARKRRRSGSHLLAYRSDGHWAEIDAEDVNAYLKDHTRGPFTAKDFRTWNATVLAAVALAAKDAEQSGQRARERAVKDAVRTVAAYLGNTPAVCRSAYIDPRVIDRFHGGVTIAPAVPSGAVDLSRPRTRTRVEAAVLDLLSDAPS